METQNKEVESTKLEKFSRGYDVAAKFITPVLIGILFIFNFGYGWRDTQASTNKDIEELKSGQKTMQDRMTTGRNERLAQVEDAKQDLKTDIKDLRESLEKQMALERDDRHRLEEKMDKIIESRPR